MKTINLPINIAQCTPLKINFMSIKTCSFIFYLKKAFIKKISFNYATLITEKKHIDIRINLPIYVIFILERGWQTLTSKMQLIKYSIINDPAN